MKITSDPIFLKNRGVFQGHDKQMERTRSRDALLSPIPYSRKSSEEREFVSIEFNMHKTHSLPRRFASSAASKKSTTSPLVAPAILRESLSKLEKLGIENASTKISDEKLALLLSKIA